MSIISDLGRRMGRAEVTTCVECGATHSWHYATCPTFAATNAPTGIPQPTAYDVAQTELRARIAALTLSQEKLERDVALDRAQAIKSEQRIEALELEVARLKGPRVAELYDARLASSGYAQALDQKIKNIEQSMEMVLSCADMGVPLPDEGA